MKTVPVGYITAKGSPMVISMNVDTNQQAGRTYCTLNFPAIEGVQDAYSIQRDVNLVKPFLFKPGQMAVGDKTAVEIFSDLFDEKVPEVPAQ